MSRQIELGFNGANAFDDFSAEGDIGLRASRGGVIDHTWHAVTGRFGKTNIARHNGLKYFVAKMCFELRGYLLLQSHSGVLHHA